MAELKNFDRWSANTKGILHFNGDVSTGRNNCPELHGDCAVGDTPCPHFMGHNATYPSAGATVSFCCELKLPQEPQP